MPSVPGRSAPCSVFFFEVGKASFAFFHMQHAVRRDADARRVIAAVFQTAKAVQQNGRRLFAADISNDSTHNKKGLLIKKFTHSDPAGRSCVRLAVCCMVDFLLRTNLAVLLSDTLLTALLFCGRPHISDCVTRAERARRRIRRIFDHVSPRRPGISPALALADGRAISSFPFCEYPYYTRERRKKLHLFSGQTGRKTGGYSPPAL